MRARFCPVALQEIEHALYFPPNNPSASVVQPLRNSIIQIAASSGDQVSDQQGYSLFLSSDGRCGFTAHCFPAAPGRQLAGADSSCVVIAGCWPAAGTLSSR